MKSKNIRIKIGIIKNMEIIMASSKEYKDAVINAVSKDGYKIQFKSEESFEKKDFFGLLKK